jgi:hypothetical protein
MWCKLKHWFQWNVNFCVHEVDGVEKPENKLYNFIYKYYFWPLENPNCICCTGIRSIVYGLIIGVLLGGFIWP